MRRRTTVRVELLTSRRSPVVEPEVGARVSQLKFRFLGGFEVWRGDEKIEGFESQKARALLAYLICNRSRSFSRSHVAGLLWPEKEESSARHGLRQALYNLRTTLQATGEDLIQTKQQTLQFDPSPQHWIDVEAFDRAVTRGHRGEEIDTHELAHASQLYRGDFLADLIVKDSPNFEEWLVSEQERIRESAIDLLRQLVGSYLERGDYRMGLQYGRRLVTVDPFSEASHRQVMKLYAMGGRRNRALAHYETLRDLLLRELGVEPLEETQALYESILTEAVDTDPAPQASAASGPLVPLVGRRDSYAELRASWHSVLDQGGRVCLVEGELGVGKSRLVKSFLDAATSKRRAFVLKGRCYPMAPSISYGVISEVLRNAFLQEVPSFWEVLRSGPVDCQQDLVRLVPDLAHSPLKLPSAEPAIGTPSQARFAETVSRTLGLQDAARRSRGQDPIILFIDDAQWADPASLSLLTRLAPTLENAALWVVIGVRGQSASDAIVSKLDGARIDRIRLDRLDSQQIQEIAVSLVGEREAPILADFLNRHTQGLPLFATELINHLWDREALLAEDPEYGLEARLAQIEPDLADGNLNDIMIQRLQHLPNSTKRLAALSSVIGQVFEAGVLQQAAGEHRTVVEVGLEILLERWIVRQFADQWNETRPESDIALWTGGARRGKFEFAHKLIRKAIYESINPIRRQVMHREVAEGLQTIYGDQVDAAVEYLAHHFGEAAMWAEALPYLIRSGERAAALFDHEQAGQYYAKAKRVASRLASDAGESRRKHYEQVEAEIVGHIEALDETSSGDVEA